ncbi:alpha/beta hydrolase [Acaricomes phytoseiuli]|uniref:alpha/beta hydrolase n=1 Tax=Acaricomes phytoseiuli TaxID=291968 RepID=UPI0014616AD0|nr:alpha/beta hydrolase [Acaricomes phytoseiuli]
MTPVPSDAVSKAGLVADTPIGNGAIAAILNPGKDRQLAALNNLYGKASAGDTQAQQQYLTALAALTSMQLALFAVWQQGQARNPLTQGRVDVPATKAWWGGLNSSTQALLIAAVPGIIGNLNGVPYSTRDKANRTLLNTLRRDLGVSERVRKALDGIEKSVKYQDGSPRADRYVIAFDLNNDKPLAAVAIGDLDTPGNVTWNIPGMGTTVAPGGIDDWTNASQNVYNRQVATLERYGPAAISNAVVSWVGYDAPEMFPQSQEVFSGDKAWVGSDKLAAALDGFYETRNAGNGIGLPKVHVVAHSYGTTNAAYALTKTSYDVSTVTFVGSAGIDPNVVPNAEAMNIKKASDGKPAVYATLAVRDLVAPAGIWGSQTAGVDAALGDFITNPVDVLGRYFDTINNQEPIQPRVSPTSPVVWPGAKIFSSEGGFDPETGVKLEETDGHQTTGDGSWSPIQASAGNGYFDTRTESLQNIALASTGHGDKIRPSSWFRITIPDKTLRSSLSQMSNE